MLAVAVPRRQRTDRVCARRGRVPAAGPPQVARRRGARAVQEEHPELPLLERPGPGRRLPQGRQGRLRPSGHRHAADAGAAAQAKPVQEQPRVAGGRPRLLVHSFDAGPGGARPPPLDASAARGKRGGVPDRRARNLSRDAEGDEDGLGKRDVHLPGQLVGELRLRPRPRRRNHAEECPASGRAERVHGARVVLGSDDASEPEHRGSRLHQHAAGGARPRHPGRQTPRGRNAPPEDPLRVRQ